MTFLTRNIKATCMRGFFNYREPKSREYGTDADRAFLRRGRQTEVCCFSLFSHNHIYIAEYLYAIRVSLDSEKVTMKPNTYY